MQQHASALPGRTTWKSGLAPPVPAKLLAGTATPTMRPARTDMNTVPASLEIIGSALSILLMRLGAEDARGEDGTTKASANASTAATRSMQQQGMTNLVRDMPHSEIVQRSRTALQANAAKSD